MFDGGEVRLTSTALLHRFLKNADGAAAAGAISLSGSSSESNSTTAETGSSNGDDDNSNSNPAEVAKNVIVLLLAGLAILIALVLLSYLVAIVADKWGRLVHGRPSIPIYSEETSRDVVSRKANLRGLTVTEREAILQKVFEATTFAYSDEHEHDDNNNSRHQGETNNEASGGDIEMGRLNSTKPTTAISDENKNGDLSETEEAKCSMNPDHNESQKNDDKDMLAIVDEDDEQNDDKLCCSICLNPYAAGESVMTGTKCNHMFHSSCCQTWLLKHDHCPYCRKAMMTSGELRQAALTVLGDERVTQLSMRTTSTTTTAAVSSTTTSTASDGESASSTARPPRWWRRTAATTNGEVQAEDQQQQQQQPQQSNITAGSATTAGEEF